MKIRIQGNSLRLRLKKQEVLQFETRGLVEESIQFGTQALEKLTYRLLLSDSHAELSSDFQQNTINVFVPLSIGKQWANSDQVGMEAVQIIDTKQGLRILIEKDFKCLTERPHEDESDAFPNPNLNC